jgi:hypothetical protein
MIIKFPKLPRSKPGAESPIPKAYRPWMMLSLAVLVVSLLALVIAASLAFVYYANVLTPLWLTLVGALAGFGVVAGFGGFFLMLLVAGYRSFKEDSVPVSKPDNER